MTVDGSKGPVLRMKPGGVTASVAAQKPILLVRIWQQTSLRLATWDRTVIPLPFNLVHLYIDGPHIPPDQSEDRFRDDMERGLLELSARSHRDLNQGCPEILKERLREARGGF